MKTAYVSNNAKTHENQMCPAPWETHVFDEINKYFKVRN